MAGALKDMKDIEAKVAKLKGLKLTAKQIKKEFGYSPTTYICDTVLYHGKFIKSLGGWPTLWLIK